MAHRLRSASDLSEHGQLIAGAGSNSVLEERLAEGAYFYTFVLIRSGIFFDHIRVNRFSETIPSHKVALGRIEDIKRLQELKHAMERAPLEQIASFGEAITRAQVANERLLKRRPTRDVPALPKQKAAASPVEEVGGRASGLIEALFAKKRTLSDVMKRPEWRELSEEERDQVLHTIEQEFDPSEISAWLDLRRGR